MGYVDEPPLRQQRPRAGESLVDEPRARRSRRWAFEVAAALAVLGYLISAELGSNPAPARDPQNAPAGTTGLRNAPFRPPGLHGPITLITSRAR